MRVTIEVNLNDPYFYIKTYRTYRCSCGCQDIRIADSVEIVRCPYCEKRMSPVIFISQFSDAILLTFKSIEGNEIHYNKKEEDEKLRGIKKAVLKDEDYIRGFNEQIDKIEEDEEDYSTYPGDCW